MKYILVLFLSLLTCWAADQVIPGPDGTVYIIKDDGTIAQSGVKEKSSGGGNKMELILGAVIAVFGAWSEYNRRQAKNSHEATTVLIKGIERAGDNQRVKEAVQAAAKEEGNTAFLHKRVKEVTAKEPDKETEPKE